MGVNAAFKFASSNKIAGVKLMILKVMNITGSGEGMDVKSSGGEGESVD